MPKNKKRLLLVVIFAVAAGIIISSKLNNTINNKLSNKIKNNDSIQDLNLEPKPSNITPDSNEIATNDNNNNPINYLTKIPECLDINVSQNDSLRTISNTNKWMSKDPKNLIRQNLIYKKGTKEFRVSIFPSESKRTWVLQSFDVDVDGLPVPKNKIMGLQYYQLADKIKSESSGFTLVSDEQDLTIDTPNISGSILYINDEPVEIKLFNKDNQRLLECQKTYCLCNQALSS